ncbi:DNA repair protein RecO [Bdellovibrio bacteriovorus]|uniref:DNA repair protein RecO n=1 Tax=Bdellovibrio bacteriovorus TaxID=959 RepID=A0A150WNR6_BDEBC|nr:DNA repair protein RecO [Bdellovibrio bacteriovorus]KYG65964.1 DNA repair protein RecO [Bdellovibrio bacteriovorus]
MTQGKDRFIILKKIKYAEADLIIHGLSPRGEKLAFIARGALKSKKRFGGGVLEPTHFVTFTYKQANEHGQLNVLQEATIVNDFPGLRTDYDRLETALHILECVSKVSQEGDRDSEFLFNLLGNTLKVLESTPDILVLKMHFYLKFLLQQGVVNAEPWMAPFLKTNLADSANLISYRQTVDDEMYNVEQMVKHYLANATL